MSCSSARRRACSLLSLVLGVLGLLGTAAVAAATPQDEVAAPLRACAALPALGKPPADALNVTRFGARADDEGDDTEAIERALAALRPGQALVFPRGRYLHNRRLAISTPKVTLWGAGATLHATNPADQALLLQADGVRVLGFTLTAVTDKRRTAPHESRIAVWRPRADVLRDGRVRDVVIRGNRIVPAVARDVHDGPLANSASSAAIFISGAEEFLVAENTVERSLADAIHITGGARNGRVLANRVRESGDDMIAVVSYLGDGMWTRNQTAEIAASIERRQQTMLVRNVLIADNDVEGQYWGRGITVVGGEDITIRNNRIVNTPHAAAIYISREQVYVTFGVRNVLVQNNTIAQVQTRRAEFNPLPLQRRLRRTGHGAIEVIAHAFDDELAEPRLTGLLGIDGVRIENNRISEVATAGIRVAKGAGESELRTGTDEKGNRVSRMSIGGGVRNVQVVSNRFEDIRGGPIAAHGPAKALALSCASNVLGGRDAGDERCGAARERPESVAGASVSCR
jgi:hypothetical protein